jgi:hypothetical protein
MLHQLVGLCPCVLGMRAGEPIETAGSDEVGNVLRIAVDGAADD